MATAPCGGTETYWRVWGDDPRPDLVLLHCSLAHSGAWDGLVRQLDRPALAFDAPAHGQSRPWDRAVDYGDQCLAVAESFLGEDPVDVIGHSFGAVTALRLALEHSRRVRRLVLIEPVLFAAAKGAPAYEAHMQVFAPFDAAMRASDPAGAAAHFTRVWGGGVAWDDLRAEQRRKLAEQIGIIPAQNGALIEDNAGLLAPGRLEALTLPVLLLEGGASPAIVPAILDTLEARLPDTTRVRVEGAAHMLPITHAGPVADVIGDFLDQR